MNKLAIGTAALLLCAGSAQAQVARVDQFAWLAGCWGFDTENGRYEEVWSAPTGNSMLGYSRRIENGYTREFEFLRIVTSGGGGFDYIAAPKGENPTRFNSVSFAGEKAVFENPDNDFPQRITYEKLGPDAVTARIEGPSQGHTMTMKFPMKRRSCP